MSDFGTSAVRHGVRFRMGCAVAGIGILATSLVAAPPGGSGPTPVARVVQFAAFTPTALSTALEAVGAADPAKPGEQVKTAATAAAGADIFETITEILAKALVAPFALAFFAALFVISQIQIFFGSLQGEPAAAPAAVRSEAVPTRATPGDAPSKTRRASTGSRTARLGEHSATAVTSTAATPKERSAAPRDVVADSPTAGKKGGAAPSRGDNGPKNSRAAAGDRTSGAKPTSHGSSSAASSSGKHSDD